MREFRHVSGELGHGTRGDLWDSSDNRQIRVPDWMRERDAPLSTEAALGALRTLDQLGVEARNKAITVLEEILVLGSEGDWADVAQFPPFLMLKLRAMKLAESHPENRALAGCTLAGERLLALVGRGMLNTSPSKLKEV